LAISKERKQELVASLVELLDSSDGFVIVESRMMPVAQVNELRKRVRTAQGKYMVVKNTLLTKALQQRGWPVPDDMLVGPVSVAFGMKNFPDVAKAVLEYTATPDLAEKIQLKGGVMTGSVLNAAQVDTVSKLPPLSDIRAQIAGLIVQPAAGLVSVLNAATGQIVNVLHAYTNKEGGEAA
jgi:large subunit ribosomal protein L10